MYRYAIDIQRKQTGDLLTRAGEWSHQGAVDDLAIASRVGGFAVAPSTVAAGERILLEVEGDPASDQAVEAIVDRSYPVVTGSAEAIGLLIGWQVAECSEATGGYTGRSESSDSSDDALGMFRCAPVEDLTLGVDNHIRVVCSGTSLQVIERRNAVSSTVWTLALSDIHRRVAIRAELVGGDLLVLINVTGVADFRDPPVFRYNTLITHAGRCGIISNRDGRFIDPVAEYKVEAHAQAVGIQDAVQLSGNLTPCRITLHEDASRPPMETGVSVCQVDDTKMAERQERWSRTYLRSMRAALRPGCKYRVIAWMRTVDDQRILIRSRDFTHAGTKTEDLRLRDATGRLILRRTDPLPAGEVRSPLDYPVFSFGVSGEIESSAEPNQGSTDRFFDNRLRGTQLSSTAPRSWRFQTDNLEQEDRDEIVAFLSRRNGRVYPFLWSHPLTGELVIARFDDGSIEFVCGEGALFQAPIKIIEEAPGSTDPNPGSGLSDSGDSGDSGGSSAPGPGFTGTCQQVVTGGGSWVIGSPTVIDLTLVKRCYRSDGTLSQEFTADIRLVLSSYTLEFALFEYRSGGDVLASATIEEGGIRVTIDPRAFPGTCAATETTIPSTIRTGCDSTIDPAYCGAAKFYNGCQTSQDPMVCPLGSTPHARWYDVIGSVISCLGGLPCTIASFRLEQVVCTVDSIPPPAPDGSIDTPVGPGTTAEL